MTYEASQTPARLLPGKRAGLISRAARTLFLTGGLLAAGIFGAGCATTGSASIYGPDLVYVSPGVQVIADYDEPIFYADGYYWRSAGGVWYRSSYYTGGWVYARPPGVILSIHNPHYYRHYRPQGWAPRGRGPAAAPVVRGGPGFRSAPPPQRSFGPGFGGAPPAHAGPPRGGFQPGPGPSHGHGGPPPRARAPMMGHGPHR